VSSVVNQTQKHHKNDVYQTSTFLRSILYRPCQIQRHRGVTRRRGRIGTPDFAGRLRRDGHSHGDHCLFQPIHRRRPVTRHHPAQRIDPGEPVRTLFFHHLDRHRPGTAFRRCLVAHCRLLRPGNTADAVPAAGRQPVFRLCHHRSQRTVLPQQRIQIHRPAKLRHTDRHRCGRQP
jgi:hypothetical protein